MRLYKMINNDEKGQSLVEFALLLPVLLILILGIIEFGFMFNAKITINSAAREGARVYAITGDSIDQKAHVDQVVNNTLGRIGTYSGSIVKVVEPLPENNTIKMAKVTITKNVPFLTNFFDFLFDDELQLTAHAEMRVEYE